MVENILLQMVRYFSPDVKRISHAFKVYGFAQSILAGEELDAKTKLVTELAAILHDIGIKEAERKYNSSAGHFQEIEGPPIARQILEQCGADQEIIERVCFLVGHHHSYQEIDGIDFQILVEADFLVNIHEGFIKPDAAPSVVSKYFKTATARELALSVYGLKI
jgi:CRISPR/Cas system-associated endonuclease Cas3-HD